VPSTPFSNLKEPVTLDETGFHLTLFYTELNENE